MLFFSGVAVVLSYAWLDNAQGKLLFNLYSFKYIIYFSQLMIVSLTIFDLFLAAAQDAQQKVMLEVAPWPRPGYGWTNSGIS